MIICQGFDEATQEYTGTIYDYDGDIRSNWKCSKEVSEFEIGNLYASFESNSYFRLSPFIHIELSDDGLYVFRNIQDIVKTFGVTDLVFVNATITANSGAHQERMRQVARGTSTAWQTEAEKRRIAQQEAAAAAASNSTPSQ